MNRNRLCIITLILLCLFVFLSFMPVVFEYSFIREELREFGYLDFRTVEEVIDNYNTNLYAPGSSNVIALFGVLLFCAISIIEMIMRIAGKEHRTTKAFAFAPVIALIMFIIRVIVSVGKYEEGYRQYRVYTVQWGVYILFVLLLSASVLSVLIVFAHNAFFQPKKRIRVYSVADEIEKFKMLSDKGIITQQEFDEKKKQLLDL